MNSPVHYAKSGSSIVMLLQVQGLRAIWGLVAVAAAVVFVFPNGVIETFGPFTLYPQLRVLQVVPLLLSLVPVVAMNDRYSAVIGFNNRVIVARSLSLVATTVVCLVIVQLGEVIAINGTSNAALRNYLLLAGTALLCAAVFGSSFAWIIPVTAFGITLLANENHSDWSLYGLLFRDFASNAQLWVGIGIYLIGTILMIMHPKRTGYLRSQTSSKCRVSD